MSGRQFSELKGGLIFAEKWELMVIRLPPQNQVKAVIKIDLLRFFGSEGEPLMGDPRDFNSYRAVIETLQDPSRQA
jgi:hypothetical protein